ncbi:MAG: hypothetical protein DMF98_09015 [Acidobacteria bacterium]|nr:MAG: hypothetical protein DMF98_09015 [Acidobacteriota bacterium]
MRCRIGSANAATPSWNDVLLLELAVRLEQHQLDLGRQIVLEIRADLLVRAFGVAGQPFEMLLELRVVVNLEVVGGIDVPVELVVVDVVLAEVGHHGRLCRRDARRAGKQERQERDEHRRRQGHRRG